MLSPAEYQLTGFVPGEGFSSVGMRVWDVGSLSWIKATGAPGVGTDVNVLNFPAVQTVTGTVAATQSGAWSVSVLGSVTVTGTVAATQSGAWSVSVTGTVTVAGTVSTKTDLVGNAPASASVGAASISILAANASRTGCFIRNTSAGSRRISLAFDGNAAVVNSGVTLFPGDAWEMNEYGFTTGEIRAICSTAGGAVSIQEWQ